MAGAVHPKFSRCRPGLATGRAFVNMSLRVRVLSTTNEGPHTMARLAHHVFFTLKDKSTEAVDRLVSDCQKYLDDHEGLVDFSVGRRDPELDRPVNVKFDVSLHVIFRDRASHDAYQTAPRHLEFIERQKDNWEQVQVCDSYLED